MKKGKKGIFPPSDEHEEGESKEEEEEEEEEKEEKSCITVDDFQKSLDLLSEIAKADDPVSRKEELLQKAQSGEDLTDVEREDLFKALGGQITEDVDEDEIVKAITGPMDPENVEPLQKALDVSEYLEAQHAAMTESLTEVAKSIDASDQRQHGFNLVLAKAIVQSGQLIKGMAERLQVIESQPARAPKSRGISASAGALEKGFADSDGPGAQVSPNDILETLESMMVKSVDAGGNGVARCGEDILGATAKYEQTRQISKSMVDEVMAFRKENAH